MNTSPNYLKKFINYLTKISDIIIVHSHINVRAHKLYDMEIYMLSNKLINISTHNWKSMKRYKQSIKNEDIYSIWIDGYKLLIINTLDKTKWAGRPYVLSKNIITSYEKLIEVEKYIDEKLFYDIGYIDILNICYDVFICNKIITDRQIEIIKKQGHRCLKEKIIMSLI